MKKILLVSLMFAVITFGSLYPIVQKVEARIAQLSAHPASCYVIMYTTVQKGDTWQKIANHWGMTVSTLKAMNKGVRFVPGAQLKLAVAANC